VTEANIKHQLAGSTDLPLSDLGCQQAKDMALRIKTSMIDAVFASPMKRTLQTARICFPNSHIKTMDELREIDFGEWECLTIDQAQEQDYERFKHWQNLDQNFGFPSGENMESFSARTEVAAKLLRNRPEKNIMVFTHAGTVKIMLCHYLGLAVSYMQKFNIETGKVSSLELFDGGAALSGLNKDSI
jgi:broad specificity phosphatase PhoE